MIRIRHLVASGLLVTVSCEPASGPLPLEPASSFDHAPDRTMGQLFIGHIEGQLTFVPPFQPGSLETCNANFSGDPAHPGPSVSGFDEARGAFSVIGRVRLQSEFCFDPDSPVSQGTGVLTALNGDIISIGFRNTAGAPTPDGMIPVDGSQWITGGTGRFTGASGDQVCRFSVNATTLQIRGSCRGAIRLHPSGG
ncbi:MAG: hypothetical protein L0271_03665 [Gemmatimonadetes bacterium]|nr:hypothetical protein [Gemmatimonadota bacterium]